MNDLERQQWLALLGPSDGVVSTATSCVTFFGSVRLPSWKAYGRIPTKDLVDLVEWCNYCHRSVMTEGWLIVMVHGPSEKHVSLELYQRFHVQIFFEKDPSASSAPDFIP